MKYQVISHDYRNTGGNIMVSVFQIYLPEQNRTVFVNCGEWSATMTTVDHINNFDPDDYDKITIWTVDFTEDLAADSDMYYDVFSYCLYEWLKKDCKHYGYRMELSYCWLPAAVREQISPAQKNYVDHWMDGGFQTDGYYVYVPTPDGDDKKIPVIFNRK